VVVKAAEGCAGEFLICLAGSLLFEFDDRMHVGRKECEPFVQSENDSVVGWLLFFEDGTADHLGSVALIDALGRTAEPAQVFIVEH
jgi:hypothetical protein